MAEIRTVVRHRLENIRGDKVYFCELVVDGVKLFTRFGQTLGANPTRIYERSGERFATREAALQAVEVFLAGRGKSYEQNHRTEELRPASADQLAPASSNPALEAEVLAGRAGAAAVFADWLQTHGDSRGELAALFQANKTDEAERWIADDASRLFGELDVKLDSELRDLAWTDGFVSGASLRRATGDSRTDLAALTRDFLALPASRFVIALRFGLAGFDSDNDWTETMRAVAGSSQAPQLRSLRFDDYQPEDCEVSWTPFGDFSPFWRDLPALEEFRLRSGAGGTLGDVELPNLKTFVRESGGLGEPEIRSILDAKWPRLEHLAIWFGSANYGAAGTAGQLAELLWGRAPETLTHLGLVNCEFTPQLIEPLARSPLLRRLRSLDLSKGVLGDGDVDAVVRHADAFRHLERFDLSENLFEDSSAIRAALANVVLDDQRDPTYRYAAVGE